MKIKHIIFCAILAIMAACSSDDDAPYALFDTSKLSYFVGDEVQMINKTGEKGYSYMWDFGDGQTSTESDPIVVYQEAGKYVVKLSATNSNGTSVHKRILNIDEPAEKVGDITLNWISSTKLGYIQATSASVDYKGDVVIASSDHILRKFAKQDGAQMWEFNLRNPADGVTTGGGTYAVPSIDTDGTIYMGTGDQSGAKGRFYAINANGSKKWMVPYKDDGFWASSGSPNPRINHLNTAIGDNTIYIGNGGTTGTALAIDKATGSRKAYIANDSNSGPTGGVTSGVLLDNKNNIFWFGGVYGLFRASATDMETNPRVNWDWRFDIYRAAENVNGAMAIGSDGTIYGLVDYSPNNIGKAVFALDGSIAQTQLSAKWYCSLESVGKVDQGGVAIGLNDVIFASLKRAVGTDGGGVVAIDKGGNILWKFGIPQDVSGTPAIDQAGNVHFATDNGYYYIISSDGATVILAVDLADLIIRNVPTSEAKRWAVGEAKCWNSPVIDSDGTIYIGVSNMHIEKTESLLLSLKHDQVTGVANSAWPMRGQNAQRTNRQPQ